MCPRPRSGEGGFTLVELLVTIGIIGVLAGLLLPVLVRAKDRGRQAACINNLRQLTIGMTMYHGDYDGMFPAPGSRLYYGPQPEDWIWWQYGRGVEHSSIVRFIDKFNSKLFTCPGDREGQDMQAQGYIQNEPYRYSYSLNSEDARNGINPGLSTIITQAREVFPFRVSQVINPSHKLMLIEEDRKTMDDPRWVAHKPSLIAVRHGKKGHVAFVDGHVALVRPEIGKDRENTDPTY